MPLGDIGHLRVEWDDAKAARNIRAHGLSFPVAARVFSDHDLLEQLDDRDDYGEERWNVIGLVGERMVFVTYTMRQREPIVRMISARFAERREVDEYYSRFIG